MLSRFFLRSHYTRIQSLVFLYFVVFKYLPVTLIIFPLIELYMRLSTIIIMEYRHIMEAYFKMIYIRSYHELVKSHDGVDITIHKRQNALKAEKELKDNYGIEYKEGKFYGQINNVDAETLFHNMSAKPECIEIKNKIDEQNKTIIVESKDDIKLLDTEKD